MHPIIRELQEHSRFNDVQLAHIISLLHGFTLGFKRAELLSFDILYRVGKIVEPSANNTPRIVQLGADAIFLFEIIGVLRLTDAGIQLVDTELLGELWETLESTVANTRPSTTPVAAWVNNKHSLGYRLLPGESRDFITKERQPLVFERVNAAQLIGWRINEFILEVATDEYEGKGEGFQGVWETASDKSSATKLIELRSILRLAHEFKTYDAFYHAYYLDFRGRVYPRTAYLHEQGSDIVRGLLLRRVEKEIGEVGFSWLFICLANTWAGETDSGIRVDKLPLSQRIKWASANESLFLSYANFPRINRGWTAADKPWRFLAYCNELKRIRNWERAGHSIASYRTGIEGCIDGTNNGSQHIAALIRDPLLARQVNLCSTSPSSEDLYAYVANAVWDSIDTAYAKIPSDRIPLYEGINQKLAEVSLKLANEMDFNKRRLLQNKVKTVLSKAPDVDEVSVVFWHGLTNKKSRRKVVKRNVMTLPYGVSRYGMINQQVEDSNKHNIAEIRDLARLHAVFMGRTLYTHSGIAGAMSLLSTLKTASLNYEFLSWTAPFTRFPVQQKYKKFKVRPVTIVYDGVEMQIKVPFRELASPDPIKQAMGVSPNVIHSLDAAHLMMVSHHCFKRGVIVTTIHDCFAAHLVDMPLVFEACRAEFVRLYKRNPLWDILTALGIAHNLVEEGPFDVEEVLNAEFCFS
jgi:DNA-directed RNA polymerase